MFGSRQRKKQEGQQRHQLEVANKYVFKLLMYFCFYIVYFYIVQLCAIVTRSISATCYANVDARCDETAMR